MKKCTWNGIEYKSVSAAARANGLSKVCMVYRINRGWVCDDDVQLRYAAPRPCIWNGVEYESISAAARANHCSTEAMSYRIRQGYTCDNDLKW